LAVENGQPRLRVREIPLQGVESGRRFGQRAASLRLSSVGYELREFFSKSGQDRAGALATH
jgi:hypothetical protein